jgi:hypothetical protein
VILMKNGHSYPKDLANAVIKHLRHEGKLGGFLPEHIEQLLEVMYFASLKREEAQAITCRIAFVSLENPDPKPPKRILADRWRCHKLDESLPLNVRNLVKISRAVDPWAACLAVDVDMEAQLRIWGFVDQSIHHNSYLYREADSGHPLPGLFQISIDGIGELSAYDSFVFIGSLRQNTLTENQPNVFARGPISEKLKKGFEQRAAKLRDILRNSEELRIREADPFTEAECIDAVCRILMGIRRYGHGGALLISSTRTHLSVKYGINYDRLGNAIEGHLLKRAELEAAQQEVHEDYLDDDDSDVMPILTHLNVIVGESEVLEANNELQDALSLLVAFLVLMA